MLCFLYTIGIAAALGLLASLIEPLLPHRAPRRWLWCAAIVLSIAIPASYQAIHNVVIPTEWRTIGAHDAVLMDLWRKTSIGLLLWGIASVLLVARAVRSARADRRRQKVVDGVSVVVTDQLGPATTGFWRSRVLIPEWVLGLPESQRRYVLRHEEEHRRAHDARMLFLASLTLAVVPWNISLWWLVRRLALAIEMDCDNRVLAALGGGRRYGELLLQVANAGYRVPRMQPGFIGGAGMLERRLKRIIAPVRLERALRYILPVLALALLITILFIPHPVMSHH